MKVFLGYDKLGYMLFQVIDPREKTVLGTVEKAMLAFMVGYFGDENYVLESY